MAKYADASGRAGSHNPAVIGLAAWAVPGLGHWLLGQRGRAIVLLAAIMLTYWTGVAVGGVRYTVDPGGNTLWFVAQSGVGPQVVALCLATARQPVPAVPWPDSDIAVIYAGVAGLLNMLVILDAVGRAAGVDAVPVEPARTTAGPPGDGAGRS
jgi:hypothetical protein